MRRSGYIFENRNFQFVNDKEFNLKEFIQLAHSLGASDVKIIAPNVIVVEDVLADLCSKSQCDNYGLSLSCPPHVTGPTGFRELQKKVEHAVALRIVAPSVLLFSSERREIMRLLHEITAEIEQAAVRAGYRESKAFAGGSCKKIFCYDQVDCIVLSENGECRYMQYARPSMSGFGINVSELVKICGWLDDVNSHDSETDAGPMSWVAGLVLIG
ncbi:MAG: DUF2284 domain-containing protein [Rubrobacteridae bacterium]|nr:DUF2284 domain-containing protein [Rubrobacteridae bacterium]